MTHGKKYLAHASDRQCAFRLHALRAMVWPWGSEPVLVITPKDGYLARAKAPYSVAALETHRPEVRV